MSRCTSSFSLFMYKQILLHRVIAIYVLNMTRIQSEIKLVFYTIKYFVRGKKLHISIHLSSSKHLCLLLYIENKGGINN
jgi:hypothetical protein